jgi:ribosomal protein S27E
MDPNYSKNDGIRQIKSFDDFDTYQCIECNGKPAYPNSMKSNEWEYQKPYLTKYEWGKREYIRCGFCNSSSFKIKNPLEKIFEWKGLIKDTINDDDESHVYRLNDTDFRIEVILPASVHKEWNYNPHYMYRDILFMFRFYASGEGRSTSIRTKCPRCNHKINTNILSKIQSEILCPNCKTSVDPIAIIHTRIQEIIKSNVELRRWAERMQESRYQEEGSRFFILDVQEKPVESEVAAKTVKTPKNRWEALEI